MEVMHWQKTMLFIALFGFLAKADLVAEKKYCRGKYQGPYTPEHFKMKDRLFSPLYCKRCGETPDRTTILNTGTTILIDYFYEDEEKIPIIGNGPMEGKGVYRFKNMYFNWIYATQTEYGYNDVEFPAELHLVFYNTKYGNYEKALEKHEGIAVLSMGFRVRELYNREILEDFVDNLKYIIKANTSTTLSKSKSFTLSDFLPRSLIYYYTYSGTMLSPTTSTCQSSVIWIDFEESLKIKPEQVLEFDKLRSFFGTSIIDFFEEYVGPQGIIYSSLNPRTVGVHASIGNGQCCGGVFLFMQRMGNGILLAIIISLFI